MKLDLEIVGFDLGHGETAVALTMFAATTEPQVLDIHGTRSTLTAVAQHPSRGTLIGDDAFMARNVSSLRIAFKSPEVERLEVREPVKLFVGKILEILLKDRKITAGDTTLYFVGCPSGWSATVRERYAELLRDAGMRHVTVWPESRAALVYARESGYISQDLAEGAILIIDIGSSTTDFTAVQNLEIRISDFGQNALGGGLIDKAILARIVATHTRSAELREIFAEHPVYAAICELECRKVKEMFFSNPEMWSDKPASKTVRLETNPPLYVDVEITPAIMEEILRQPLSQLQNRSWKRAFQDALLHAKERMEESPPQLVLLTGGASRMGFTSDLCDKVFPATRVIRGAEPEFAIARGLAGAGRIELKTKAFRGEVEALLASGQLQKAIKSQLPALVDAVARFLVTTLPEQIILPAFWEWREGRIRTLNALEEVVQPRATEWLASAEGKQQLGEVVIRWFYALLPAIEKLTNPICDLYRIPQTSLNVPAFLSVEGMTEVPRDMVDMGQVTFLGDLGSVAAILGSIIVAHVLGGGGTALLLHGPLGLLLGFLIGLVTLSLGKGVLIDWFKSVEVPMVGRGLVSETRIRAALHDKQSEFEDKIRDSLNSNLLVFTELVDAIHDSINVALHKAADRAALLIR